MATIIGYVQAINGGTYIARSGDGEERTLNVGDPIYEDDVVVVGLDTNGDEDMIVVTLENGEDEIVLAGNEAQLFDASLRGTAFSEDEVQTGEDELSEFLAQFGAPDNIDDIETAADEEDDIVSSEAQLDGFHERQNPEGNIQSSLRDAGGTSSAPGFSSNNGDRSVETNLASQRTTPSQESSEPTTEPTVEPTNEPILEPDAIPELTTATLVLSGSSSVVEGTASTYSISVSEVAIEDIVVN
jgi:hypothetical protein